jgi:hypothetical protein
MKLDVNSEPLTAFTIPGKGQFCWITSPMGLLGCLAIFQCLMETVLHCLNNVIVYIDDLLIRTTAHEDQLADLKQVFQCLEKNDLEVFLSTLRYLT